MPDPSLHHISLTCDDPIAVERFYTKHFGFHRVRVVPMDGGAQIVFLRGAGTLLELFGDVGPPTGEGYRWPGVVRNFSFEVDDVDGKIAEIGSDRVTREPQCFGVLVPDAPRWRSAWLRDPAGNIIQITTGYTAQQDPPPLPPE